MLWDCVIAENRKLLWEAETNVPLTRKELDDALARIIFLFQLEIQLESLF